MRLSKPSSASHPSSTTMTKYILVSGGVISGIGKGVIGVLERLIVCFLLITATIVASSTGLLLKMTGLKVTAIKIDPYMNIDAGTMAPTEHGSHSEPFASLDRLADVKPIRRGLRAK